MLWPRRRSNGYIGTFAWKGDGVWTVIVRGETSERSGSYNSIPPQNLFDQDVLTNQLRQEGVQVQAVAFRDRKCLIAPTLKDQQLYPEARLIQRVLSRNYPTHNGRAIRWYWDTPQHD